MRAKRWSGSVKLVALGAVVLTAALGAVVPAGAQVADPSTTTTTTPPTTTSGPPSTTGSPTTESPATEPPTTATAPAVDTAPAGGAPVSAEEAPSALATPNTNLVNLQTITLSGNGFPPNTAVGWAECKAGPGTPADCASDFFGSATTDGSGSFSAPFVVRRMMHAQSGTLDCAAAPGTCKIGVGVLSNYAISASASIDFDPNAPLPPPPVLQAAPTTNLVDGQSIAVLGTGFAGSMPIQASECVAGTNQCGVIGGYGAQVNSVGTFLTALAVQRQIIISQWATFDCASAPNACELMVTSQGDPDATARLAIDFAPAPPIVGATVTVTPDTGITNFQTVTVAGSGYDVSGQFPGVGVTVCKTGSTADGDCVGNQSFAQLDPSGAFSTTLTLRRIVHFSSGDFDCGSAPAVCEVRAVSFAGTPRVGRAVFSFAPGPPPPPPAITVTPDVGLVSRQSVTIAGSNFAPDTFVQISECPAGVPGTGPCNFFGSPAAHTDGTGAFTATFNVARGINSFFSFPAGVVDCGDAPGACVINATSYDNGDSASAPIAFDASVPVPVPAVTVTPSLDLAERQVVAVDASGFQAGESVYVEECPAGAVICGNTFPPQTQTQADANGEVHTTLRVRRELPGGFSPPANCAAAVGTCVIRVASLEEPLSAAEVPLGFDPTAVAPGPTLVVSPPGPWSDGQSVALSGSGFTPGAELGVAECTATGNFNGSTCARSLFDPVWADDQGNFSTTVTITRTFQSQDATVDCATVEGGCVLFAANRQDYGAERASVPLVLAGGPALLAFTGGAHVQFAYAGAAALGLGLLVLLLVRRRQNTV